MDLSERLIDIPFSHKEDHKIRRQNDQLFLILKTPSKTNFVIAQKNCFGRLMYDNQTKGEIINQ